MTEPDPKTVREIAREAVRRGGSDSGYGFIGSVISDHAAMDEMLASGDRAAFGRLHAAVRAELKGAAITVEWPDEQQPADVVTAEQQQDGAVEAVQRFAAAWRDTDKRWSRQSTYLTADGTEGGAACMTEPQLRAVLAERTALAARVAELESEREADTRAVVRVKAADTIDFSEGAFEEWSAANGALYDRFADRIEAQAAAETEEC